MADNTLETLADIQSMIDIMSERLVALRDLRLQEFIKEEIRSLEGKLLKQFWEQLRTKSLASDKKHASAYQSYPSLSKWLVVVGVSSQAKEKFIAELRSVESLLSLSDNEISKFLDGLPGDKEDVRKVCTALSLLRSFNKNKDKPDADGIYWDSWKKSSNESIDCEDNSAGVDYNENVRLSPKTESTSAQSTTVSNSRNHSYSTSSQSSSERKNDGHRGKLSSSGNESKYKTPLSNTGTSASSLNAAAGDNSSVNGHKNIGQPATCSDRMFTPIRPPKHDRPMTNQLLSSKGKGSACSSLSTTPVPSNPSPLNVSGEKNISTGKRPKKRPGSIELPDSLPDFVDMLRPNSANRIRKASQTTSTSYESSCGSPMSPRTPLTPSTPITHNMFSPYHGSDYQISGKPSRFKGFRAFKDKIKDKMGISNKLRRNKSEERLDETGNERYSHKHRSDTCPDTNALITGLDSVLHEDTVDASQLFVNPAMTANNLSHFADSVTDSGFINSGMFGHHDGLANSRENLTDTVPDGNDYPTRSNSSDGEAGITGDESEDSEDIQSRYRGMLMRQSSAMSNVQEEWDVPWDELVFQERIGQGRVGTVYKGKWHGEVAIRVIDVCHNDENKLRAFKEEIMRYKKTRHDNVELFMGSSMNPPKLAIITSYCRGKSLYQYIRTSKDHVNLNIAKIIAQHIAQGMGYLHSRGIVHKDLKSKNVFIDGKRVTITDFGIMGLNAISSKSIAMKPGTLQIPDGWLCYMAPEIIRALRVPDENSFVAPSLPYTKESDMYAFGTVWYELLTSTWPFQGYSPESIIWQVGNGRKQSLSNLQGSKEVKDILMACWARDPSQRQEFTDSGVMGQLLRLPQAKIIRRSSQPIKGNKKAAKHGGLGTNDRLFDLSLHSVIHELAE